MLDSIYVYATLAALLVGLSKTGVPGIGILQVPLMAFVVGDAKDSVGVLLPILLVADFFAVAFYRRHTQWKKVLGLIPWVAIGMAVGTVALLKTERAMFGPALGVLVLCIAVFDLLKNRISADDLAHHPFLRYGAGIAGGFATTAGNAAGPIMNLYLLSQKLTKEEFMGVMCWLFFIINLSKFPIYVGLDMIRKDTLMFNLYMLPGIVIGVLLGRWVLPKLSQKWFNQLIIVFSILSALKLIIG